MKSLARNPPEIALRIAVIPALLAVAATQPVQAQTSMPQVAAPSDEQQARDVAIEAYVYLYPLVSIDVTRRQISSVGPGKGFGGPTNTFTNIRAYPARQWRRTGFQRPRGRST